MGKNKNQIFVDKNEEKQVTPLFAGDRNAVDANEPTKSEIRKARLPFYILIGVLLLILIALAITLLCIY